MALVPFDRRRHEGLARLHDEIDELFEGFLRDWHWPFRAQRPWPVIDIAEQDEAIIVRAEVPGCKAEDIDISIQGRTLTISGGKKQQFSGETGGCYYSECCYGQFRRDVTLPSEVDAEKVEAQCTNGVLTVTLPKAEKARAVKVKVKG